MGLNFAKKDFSMKERTFSWNVQYFKLAHLQPKFGLFSLFFFFFFLLLLLFFFFFFCCPFSIFLFLPFFFSFFWPFYSRYLLLFISFLSAVKSWVLIKSKPGNGTFINYRYNGPFYPIFAPKTDRFFSNLLRHNVVDVQNGQLWA